MHLDYSTISFIVANVEIGCLTELTMIGNFHSRQCQMIGNALWSQCFKFAGPQGKLKSHCIKMKDNALLAIVHFVKAHLHSVSRLLLYLVLS